VTGRAIDADLSDNPQCQVLGRNRFRQRTAHVNQHRARLNLRQTLRRQHVLNFAGADAEGQRAKGAVGAGMAVAANNRHSRPGQSQLRSDDMDDALFARINIEKLDPEGLAIRAQHVDLLGGDRIEDWQRPISGRNVVIDGAEGEVGPANGPIPCPQSVECLRRGHLMNQVQVYVKQ
jgi:hypothetical protein